MSSAPASTALHKAEHKKTLPADFSRLDARLAQIRQTVLPDSPYLVTIPNAQEFRLSPPQAVDWRRGTHFEEGEEIVQYASFLKHDNWDQSLVQAVGGWDNERGEMIDSSPNGRGAISGTATPKPGQTTGKKMTLADYKLKKAGGTPAVKAEPASTGQNAKPGKINGIANKEEKMPEKMAGVDVKEVKGLKNTVSVTVKEDKSLARADVLQESKQRPTDTYGSSTAKSVKTDVKVESKKRPLDTIDNHRPGKSHKPTDEQQPPSKKMRSSPLPPQYSPLTQESKLPSSQPAPPPKLEIPSITLPTLPDRIEKKLDPLPAWINKKLGQASDAVPSVTVSDTRSKKTIPEKGRATSSLPSQSSQEVNVRKKREPSGDLPRTGKDASGKNRHSDRPSSPPSQSQDSTSSLKAKSQDKSASVNGTQPKNLSPGKSDQTRKDAVKSTIATGTPPSRSLIVKIKIPKAKRKDVARLLQMQPRKPKQELNTSASLKSKESAPASKDGEQNNVFKSEGNLGKVKSGNVKPGNLNSANHRVDPQSSPLGSKEKRPREEFSDTLAPPSKRQKKPNDIDAASKRPTTPLQKHQTSSSVSTQASTSKLQEGRSTLARLNAPASGVKTPQGSTRAGTPLAPNSAEKPTYEGKSTSNPSSTGTSASSRSADNPYSRYNALARSLKHESDALFRSCEDRDDPQVEKKAIATGIESVLTFMLAYTITDNITDVKRKSVNISTWETIFGYLMHVKLKTVGNTLMHGLLLQLEAFCRNNVLKQEIIQLTSTEAPSTVAPSPEAERSTPSRPKITPEDYQKLKAKVAENTRLVNSLWIEGAFELSVDDLQQSFPISWKKKARAPLAWTKEKLSMGSLNGDFYLPLSGTSTDIEVIRAAWSLLTEWCKAESVEWLPKLIL